VEWDAVERNGATKCSSTWAEASEVRIELNAAVREASFPAGGITGATVDKARLAKTDRRDVEVFFTSGGREDFVDEERLGDIIGDGLPLPRGAEPLVEGEWDDVLVRCNPQEDGCAGGAVDDNANPDLTDGGNGKPTTEEIEDRNIFEIDDTSPGCGSSSHVWEGHCDEKRSAAESLASPFAIDGARPRPDPRPGGEGQGNDWTSGRNDWAAGGVDDGIGSRSH